MAARCNLALLLALVMLAGWAVPADAAVPRIRLPRVYDLPQPQLRVPHVPTAGIDDITSGRYGLADDVTVAQLDEAGVGLGDDVERTADQVRANAEARVALRECTGEGLQGAGTSYAEAVQEAAFAAAPTPAPNFDQVIEGTSSCLQSYFPQAPDEMFQMATYLGSLAAERAQEAAAASDSAAVLAEWMKTTGTELPQAAAVETFGDGTPSDATESDAGFPWWAAILVVAALLGGAAFLKSRPSSGR